MITILPSDPVGRSIEIVDWCRWHGVNAHAVYKIEADGKWVWFYCYEVASGSGANVKFRVDALTTGRLVCRQAFRVKQLRPLPTEEQVLENKRWREQCIVNAALGPATST